VATIATGCGTVQAFADLTEALQDEGFSQVQVNVAGGDPVSLTVRADAPPGDSTDDGHRTAAELVWDRFPRRFEQARFTIDGDRRVVTRAQLQDRFGDRPGRLDEQGDLADDINRIGFGLVLSLLLGGVLLVAVVAVVTLVVVRSRRRTVRRPLAGPFPPPTLTGPAPWAPPPGGAGAADHDATPPAPPVPPATGWTPAPPPTDGHDAGSPPTAPASAPTHRPPDQDQTGAWSPRPWTPPGEPEPRQVESKADARRLGRPARGPRPPDSQIPPGWS